MNHKELFIKALKILFNAWGSDTPAEVYWGGNELLEWYEVEYDVQLNIRFDEENPNFDEVVLCIQNS